MKARQINYETLRRMCPLPTRYMTEEELRIIQEKRQQQENEK